MSAKTNQKVYIVFYNTCESVKTNFSSCSSKRQFMNELRMRKACWLRFLIDPQGRRGAIYCLNDVIPHWTKYKLESAY